MKKEHRYYEVFPRVLLAHQHSVVTIRPRFDHCRFQNDKVYRVTLIPSEGLPREMQWPEDQSLSIAPKDGSLQVPCQFAGEQEYLLVVRTDQDEPVAEFRLYALEEDLFTRRPYKGDTHMHTYYSDGKESPAYLAAACRKIGMDFIAITDHHRYAPSLEAIQAFKDTPVDLRIFPGEEVHPPDNRVHIVNFGGNTSVNKLFKQAAYHTEVENIIKQLTYLPEGVDRYPYASCLWTFDKIRQAGGLGIFCHPYWYSRQRFDVPVDLTDLLFEYQPYDALEVLGGFHLYESESNVIQLARYHELRASGKCIPIVGASDSHGCENGQLFGWYYTIVFSLTPDLPELIASVKDCYSVAVEALPHEMVRAFGPFRLVCFAQFLLREILPEHDELCLEEGRLMLAHAAGDPLAAQALQPLQGRIDRLNNRLWASV
jgi:PHP domain